MMETMRNLAQTIMAKILLGLLVVAFGLWGITGVAGSAFEQLSCLVGFCPKDLVQVGAITIKGDEYTANMQRQIRNMAQQTGQAVTLDDARKMGVNTTVLESMIAQAAVTTSVRKLGLTIGQKDLESEVYSNKQFHDQTGKFNPIAFSGALANAGMTQQQYFANQARMRTEQAVLGAASDQIALPKTFADAVNIYQGETRDVKYFDITATVADASAPTDADLQAQYKKDPGSYTAPEYRTGVVMVADAASQAATQTVSEAELQKAWETRSKEFGIPERRSIIQLTFKDVDGAAKAKTRLAAGEDILKIAGELGLKEADVMQPDKLREEFLDKTIADAAFALKEGEVSDPVKGSLATALLKAVKVVPAVTPTLAEATPELTKRLQLEKAKATLQDIYNAVEDSRAKSVKLEDIADQKHLLVTVLQPISASGITQDGKDISATLKPEVLKALFASDVGVDNDALQVADGFAWYDVRSVIPSALRPFETIKDKVKDDVVAARVRQAANDKAKAVVAAIQGGKSFEAAAAEAGATIKTQQGLKRNQQSDEFDGAANAQAFGVAEQGVTFAPGGDGKTARIIQVVKTNFPAMMAASPALTELRDQMKSGFGNDLQSSLVDALKKSAGVKLNADLWKLVNNGEAPVVE